MIHVEKEIWKPEYFVSGGQAGADSIPLECAHDLGVKIIGYMPKGFKRDDGKGETIAKKYNLIEGDGGYRRKDEQNMNQSDALLGFLCTRDYPCGKGTMQTANGFISGAFPSSERSFTEIKKPTHMPLPHNIWAGQRSFTIYPRSKKPVLIIWDLEETNVKFYAVIVKDFLNLFQPKRLMFAGPTLKTDPNITENGVSLMKLVFE